MFTMIEANSYNEQFRNAKWKDVILLNLILRIIYRRKLQKKMLAAIKKLSIFTINVFYYNNLFLVK